MIEARGPVRQTVPYSRPDGARTEKVRLDLNESSWGCSPKVIEALRQLNSRDVSVYPQYGGLVRLLADRLGVGCENVLLTSGADDGIRCIADAYLERGCEVVLPVPTFTVYAQYCGLREADVKEVRFEEDLSYPVEGILRAISPATRIVVLVNPNNPTGTSLQSGQLRAILRAARDCVVLLDEAYCHFAGQTHVGLVERFPNLMVLRTFSKAYGLAGLRMGCVVSAAQNIENLTRVNPPFAVNSLGVMAACAALEDEEWVERVVREVRVEKGFLHQQLRGLGVETLDTETNFILARVGPSVEYIREELAERGILTKSLNRYPLLGEYLRITVGRREENLRLVEELGQILPVQALLFDMDGVLVDVSNSYRLAIKRTAEQFLGEEVSLSEIQDYKDMGGVNNDWDLTARIVGSRGREVARKEIVRVFQRYYLGDKLDGLIQDERWLLRPDLLRRLGSRYALGIVTGRPRREAEYTLERFDVADLFQVVVAMEDTPQGRGKPDPCGVELAMDKLGVRRAMYLGDTVDDVQAAIAASAIPVGVVSEGGDARTQSDVLRAEGARIVLNDVNDIVGVVT